MTEVLACFVADKMYLVLGAKIQHYPIGIAPKLLANNTEFHDSTFISPLCDI